MHRQRVSAERTSLAGYARGPAAAYPKLVKPVLSNVEGFVSSHRARARARALGSELSELSSWSVRWAALAGCTALPRRYPLLREARR